VYCWGLNADGQLGYVSQQQAVPVRVTAPAFVTIDAGAHHVCGLTSDAEVFCWGRNLSGELGLLRAERSAVPVRASVPALFSLDAGAAHTCGVTARGTVFCWGDPGDGRLGLDQPPGYHVQSSPSIFRHRENQQE
jgi:alpha-tubulin suppressor-like RCC1 family protein